MVSTPGHSSNWFHKRTFFWFLREDVIICIWIDTDVHVIINIDLCECMDTHICLKRNESEKCKGIENMSSDLQKQGASWETYEICHFWGVNPPYYDGYTSLTSHVQVVMSVSTRISRWGVHCTFWSTFWPSYSFCPNECTLESEKVWYK